MPFAPVLVLRLGPPPGSRRGRCPARHKRPLACRFRTFLRPLGCVLGPVGVVCAPCWCPFGCGPLTALLGVAVKVLQIMVSEVNHCASYGCFIILMDKGAWCLFHTLSQAFSCVATRHLFGLGSAGASASPGKGFIVCQLWRSVMKGPKWARAHPTQKHGPGSPFWVGFVMGICP